MELGVAPGLTDDVAVFWWLGQLVGVCVAVGPDLFDAVSFAVVFNEVTDSKVNHSGPWQQALQWGDCPSGSSGAMSSTTDCVHGVTCRLLDLARESMLSSN